MSAKVLFVCLGNICRSPVAHGVFEHLVQREGLDGAIAVDSAGTGEWHIGCAPDQRAAAAALKRGYDLSHLRARQVTSEDFREFDYIVAMDFQNLDNLEAMRPADFAGELKLLRHYCEHNGIEEVPDPYYGGDEGFDHVLDLVEEASEALLTHIRARLSR